MHPSSAPASDAPLRIVQKRFGARAFFEFGEDSLRWGLDDGGSARTWTIEYAELAQEREQLVERHTWWRNLGLVWVAVGLLAMGLDASQGEGLRWSIWLPLGAASLVAYAVRIRRYTVVPGSRCNVMVLEGRGHAEVLAEIDRRRAAQLRDRFDYLSPDESPEQNRHRVLWLQRQGSLDDHEVSARLLQIDLMAHALPDGPAQRDED